MISGSMPSTEVVSALEFSWLPRGAGPNSTATRTGAGPVTCGRAMAEPETA